MSYQLMVILSYSILPAAVAGIIRFNTIATIHYPLIICICLGTLNEVLSTFLVSKGYCNAINNNIYSLAEALLILYLFRQWGLFDFNRRLPLLIGFTLITVWGYEFRTIEYLGMFRPYFKCFAAFIIVIMSIISMNKLITEHESSLLRSFQFICCTGFWIYFSTNIVIEISLYYGLGQSRDFQDTLFKTGCIVNVISNLLYLMSILWMPRKQKFITP